ncbi:hypothetical protein EC1_01590 [Faecalitalea cylindroides T2-87]|uniref:Uncharacterized protein n=1 Tax=Faecalitalea cylindroides T2-87 TaxID=717960 RepID=D4JCM4_9FIRM|nr:hypothetical protein EC1_01590 [Faecalitalea cylindroides T2-87]
MMEQTKINIINLLTNEFATGTGKRHMKNAFLFKQMEMIIVFLNHLPNYWKMKRLKNSR